MDATSEIRVTLSRDLIKQLRQEAVTRHVPLRWLVAGLVCDTLEARRPVVHESRSRSACA
jgi:hypothetical protein